MSQRDRGGRRIHEEDSLVIFREGGSVREFCELLLGSILFVGNCSWKTGEIGWVADREKEKEEEEEEQQPKKEREERPELLN